MECLLRTLFTNCATPLITRVPFNLFLVQSNCNDYFNTNHTKLHNHNSYGIHRYSTFGNQRMDNSFYIKGRW